MGLWNYRSEAIGHVWELVTLGCERPDDCKQLYEMALADPKNIDTLAMCILRLEPDLNMPT